MNSIYLLQIQKTPQHWGPCFSIELRNSKSICWTNKGSSADNRRRDSCNRPIPMDCQPGSWNSSVTQQLPVHLWWQFNRTSCYTHSGALCFRTRWQNHCWTVCWNVRKLKYLYLFSFVVWNNLSFYMYI